MKWPNWIKKDIVSALSEKELRLEAASRDTRSSSSKLSEMISIDATTLQVQNMAKWKAYIALATDPDQSDKDALVDLYKTLMLDNHLMSAIDTRILASQRSPFKIVNEKGEENEELTWLFERPWHAEFMYKVIFEQFKGCTLVELYELNEEGELATI